MDNRLFDKIEMEKGCGYWYVCDDHACSCSPTSQVGKGYNEEVYEKMKKQYENYISYLMNN